MSVQRARAFSFFAVAPLFALAVLALNDHLLKPAFHNALTGKLSDLAGCFVLPLFVASALGFATRWSVVTRVWTGAAVTVLFFSAIKLSSAAADHVALGLERLGAPLHLGAMHIVADPTDLFALPMALLAVAYAVFQEKAS